MVGKMSASWALQVVSHDFQYTLLSILCKLMHLS